MINDAGAAAAPSQTVIKFPHIQFTFILLRNQQQQLTTTTRNNNFIDHNSLCSAKWSGKLLCSWNNIRNRFVSQAACFSIYLSSQLRQTTQKLGASKRSKLLCTHFLHVGTGFLVGEKKSFLEESRWEGGVRVQTCEHVGTVLTVNDINLRVSHPPRHIQAAPEKRQKEYFDNDILSMRTVFISSCWIERGRNENRKKFFRSSTSRVSLAASGLCCRAGHEMRQTVKWVVWGWVDINGPKEA